MYRSIIKWLNKNSGLAEWLTFAAVGVGAFFIGWRQTKINEATQKMEDSVELFAYSGKGVYAGQLLLTNVGKLRIYLRQYSINGDTVRAENVLIPAGQQQNAWYGVI